MGIEHLLLFQVLPPLTSESATDIGGLTGRRSMLRIDRQMLNEEIEFGAFRFNPTKRLLWDGDTPVHLGGRALAILSKLIETPGNLVSKEQLRERAWPGLTVDESNLKVQISGLRKALRDDGSLIRAESSLGYRFVGTVVNRPSVASRLHPPRTATTPLGRDEVIKNIIDLFEKNRLVTILGSGGIGKTTVALAVANQIDNAYTDGICFVDLGRAADERQVYAAITGALRFPVAVEPTIEQVLLALHGRRLLLILDSCEHVTERIALFVESALGAATDVDILVTTREALRVGGEMVWRLDPLETPPLQLRPTAANIQHYSSVQLFTRTARQGAAHFLINDENAGTIAEICRRLDGIPLAIELAASMVGALGVDEIHRRLDERFSVLNLNRRTAIPRQRSLAATIDWSYNLLPDREQAALRRLACYVGPFTLHGAIAVASDEEMDAETVREAVVALTNKSFLTPDHQANPPEYRLLETMRAYATQASSTMAQELERAKERHARYFLDLLELNNGDAYDSAAECRMRGCLEEIHAALDWAFPAVPHLGISLTLAAERLWFEPPHFRGIHYLRLALNQVDADPDVDALLRARVLVSAACAEAFIISAGQDDTTLYERAWRAAQIAQDEFLQLRALYALIENLLHHRRPLSPYLDQFRSIAARSEDCAVQHLPLMLSAYQDVECSDILSSSRKFESFIANCPYFPGKYTSYFRLKGSCETTLALIRYWLGYCGEASLLFASLVERAANQPSTLCFALAHGAIWCELRSGNIQRAGVYLSKLEEISRPYRPSQVFVKVYRALLIREEWKVMRATDLDLRTAEKLLSHSLQSDVFLRRQGGLFPILLFELAETRLMLGDLDGAEVTLGEALTYCRNDQDARIIGVHHPILARVLMRRNRPGDRDTARKLFKRALEVTRFRGAYYFEVEAAVGLAELELLADNPVDAKASIMSLLSRIGDRDPLPGFAKAQAILDRVSPDGNRQPAYRSL